MKVLLILAGLAGLGLLYWLWSKGNVVPRVPGTGYTPTPYGVVTDPLSGAMFARDKPGFWASPIKGANVTPSAIPVKPSLVTVETLSPTSTYTGETVYG